MITLRLRPPGQAGNQFHYLLEDENLIENFKLKYPGNIIGCCYEVLPYNINYILLFGTTNLEMFRSFYWAELTRNVEAKPTFYGIEHIEDVYELNFGDNEDMYETFKEFPGKSFLIGLDNIDWNSDEVKRFYIGGQPFGAY